MCFCTLCGGDLLALLDILGINNSLAEVLGDLVRLSFGHLLALLICIVAALGSCGV